MRAYLGVAWLLFGCGDRDFDGFGPGEDCDNRNALIYPGAADLPGDGIDSDCDGVDPSHRFIGAWDVDSFSAEVAQESVVDAAGSGGTLDVDDALAVTATILVNVGIPVPIELDGTANPLAAEAFNLDLEGVLAPDLLNEDTRADLDCVPADEGYECEGAVLFSGLNVNGYLSLR